MNAPIVHRGRKDAEKMHFRLFVDEFLSRGCDDFVTLYTSAKKPWEYKDQRESRAVCLKVLSSKKWRTESAKRFNRAQKNQRRWLDEVRENGSPNFGYLMIIENRPSYEDCLFHILLRGCDWEEGDFGNWWARRWNEISGGKAFDKKLDERIRGLIRYFVAEKGLLLELDGERYRKEDFDEWKTY
jgi:hypothetical protein